MIFLDTNVVSCLDLKARYVMSIGNICEMI